MHSIKHSGYRMGIKLNKNNLAVDQNNYPTKILNFHIVYDLDAWLTIPTNNFIFKKCLFGATDIVKIVISKKVCV